MTHEGNQPVALIVEDEYDVSLIFVKAVEAAGFRAETAHSGDAALAWLDSNVPALVILDLHLPTVPGTEILKHIRNDPRLTRVPVIVATAYARMVEGLQEQADRVLFKPVSFSRLRDLAARFAISAERGHR